MELIPVFAFIVLVASIGTFIFSLAAYFLYKIREKRGKFTTQYHPTAFKAELVAPNYYYMPEGSEFDNAPMNGRVTQHEHQTNNNSFIRNQPNENGGSDKKNGNELIWR